MGPHGTPVEELGLDMISLDGLGVPPHFVLPCCCLHLQSQSPPSPELSGALGDMRGALSQAVITARQAAALPAHSEQF